ncbi:MAG: glycosyltransferase [Paracoccaceae bacterium]|nr:glycosyltransferase [Paracoccaceae bacterium]
MPPLRIALLAHARHPIAPPFMGGMEAHCFHLAHALAARGHEVTLVAAGDSRVDVPVLPLLPRHYDRDFPWHEFHGTDRLNAYLDASHAEALARIGRMGFDIIHNNTLHRYPPRLARAARVPMVTSLHVPPFDALQRAIRESHAPWHRITGCSARHLSAYWPEGAPDEGHVVPHGTDLKDWRFCPKGDGSAVWAGRITPNKAPHLAIAAARAAGVPLTLFGMIEDHGYFDAQIRPALGGDIRYGGHVGASALAAAFGAASVLLFTPQWDEPFGLTAIEAMACGTPVAAVRMGAVEEVIGDAGRYAAPDGTGLDRALLAAMTIPRAQVRRRVEGRFSLERMVDAYEALYTLARRSVAAEAAPVRFPRIELPASLPAHWPEASARCAEARAG